MLQNELRGHSTKIVLVAFDLLYLNRRDLRKLPLKQRKAALKKLVAGSVIQFSDGVEMLAHTCRLGCEGVVSKIADSVYPIGARSRDWVKKICAQRETLTIAGIDGNDWDGIYVGRREGDALIYAGKVDHGFDKVSAADLRQRLTPLTRKTQPYTEPNRHKGIWVEPKLLAEIKYRAKSAEGKVRHPFFCGLRENLRAHRAAPFATTAADHPDQPWTGPHACTCGGAGAPCPRCNKSEDGEIPEMPPDFSPDET
ncbi:ATP-dependent DNA ligase [Bradyrhizobium sp. USDA 4473]